MPELRIERDHPGRTARFWREGDTVIVQLGRDLDQLAQRRIIREAMRTHGVRRRRRVLPVLIPPRLRDTIRDHPTSTAAIGGILAAGVAAGALLGTALPGDEPRRKRPPAAAGPSPTHGPSAPAPPAGTPPTGRPSPGAPPGRQDPARTEPARAPAGPGAAPTRPAPTRPPVPPPAAEPPPEPPPEPAAQRCLLRLNALGLAGLRLLCHR